jgi:hypothetical protein
LRRMGRESEQTLWWECRCKHPPPSQLPDSVRLAADSVTNSLYVVSLSGRGTALLELGLFSRLFQHDPTGTGFFRPIGNRPGGADTHVELIHETFALSDDKATMTAVDYDTAGERLGEG